MDSNESLIDNFIKLAISRTFSLETELKELLIIEYYSEGPRKLLELMDKLTRCVRSKLIEIKAEQKINKKLSKKDRLLKINDIEIEVKRINLITIQLHTFIQFIEETNSKNVPRIFNSLEEIIKKFYTNFEVVTHPQSEYNYSYIEIIKLLKNCFKEVEISKPIFDSFSESLIILEYPKAEKDNILQQCIMGHEIGHFIEEIRGISKNILPQVKVNETYLNEIIKNIRESPVPIGKKGVTLKNFIKKEEIRGLYLETVSKIIDRWIKEVFSDMFAIKIFGLSYFFAITQFTIAQEDIDLASESHPSARIRISILLKELKKSKFPNHDEIKKEINKIEEYLANKSIKQKDTLIKLLEESLLNLIPIIQKEVIKIVKNKSYETKLYNEEVPKLVDSLLSLIPPNEYLDLKEKPSKIKISNLISIFNAGWFFKLTKMNEFYKMFEAHSLEKKDFEDQKLNKLVSKALELREIKIKMRSAGG